MRGRVEPQQPFRRMTLTLKNVRSAPRCCFRWWNRAKIELEGRSAPERRMRAVLVNCFHQHIFKAWSHLWAGRSPPCQANMRREWASVRPCQHEHTCVPHVILRCEAVVAAAHRPPQVHKSHLSFLCVCVIPRPTPATNQRRRGQRGDVLMILHVRTSTCEHVPARRRVTTKEQSAVGGWLICQQRLGGYYKAGDGGTGGEAKGTIGKIQFKEAGCREVKAAHTREQCKATWMKWRN